MTANRLRRHFDPDEAEIHVVDRDDRHVYQPGLLFVPFGLADPGEIVRPRHAQLADGVQFRVAEVERVEAAGASSISRTGSASPTTSWSLRAVRRSSPRRPR